MTLKQQHRTLYHRVADTLRGEVAALEPGATLEAESRLAKRFGVSVATVREAIRVLAAEGVVEPRQGKGTVVLPRQERFVALLLDLDILAPRLSPFYREIVRSTREELERAGIAVRHYYGRTTVADLDAETECDAFFEDLDAGRFSGIIAFRTVVTPGLKERCSRWGIPLIGGRPGYDYRVGFDADSLLGQAVDYAVSQGRRRIAALAWNSFADGEYCSQRQFRRALARHHLEAPDRWYRADLHPYLPGAGWENFREIWRAEARKPDALIVCDDCLLDDTWAAISDLGISVPDDLLVLSQTMAGAPPRYPVVALETSPRTKARIFLRLLRAAWAGVPSASETLPFRLIPPTQPDHARLPRPHRQHQGID